MKKPRVGKDCRPPCNCMQVREKVFSILDGRLTPAKKREALRRMGSCPVCFSRLEFERIMRKVLRKRVLAERCPLTLIRRVKARIAGDPRSA